MCGIVFSLRKLAAAPLGEVGGWDELCALNACRGPDHNAQHIVHLSLPALPFPGRGAGGEVGQVGQVRVEMSFFSSVLHLRGREVTRQPIVASPGEEEEGEGDVFCWNGEVFEGLDVGEEENDGSLLFQALRKVDDPREVLGRLEGPYAFVFLKRSTRQLFFARDPLGRRSLLRHEAEAGDGLLLASVGIDPGLEPKEVDPRGVWCVDLEKFALEGLAPALRTLPRDVRGAREEWVKPCPVNPLLPPEEEPGTEDEEMKRAVDEFLSALERSVRLRVEHIPRMNRENTTDSRVAVLFSGGVDCTLLACLAHRCLPLEEGIDLLNVAFENPRKLGLGENAATGKKKKRRKPQPLDDDAPEADAEAGEAGTPKESEEAANVDEPEPDRYAVPDRITGLDAVAELREVCPGRKWNFVAVDVPYTECLAHQEHVMRLMYPSETVMDLSLANALYFASRGIGRCQSSPSTPWELYESPARVLLSGLGADEQLAGYSRHRRAFERAGWSGLREELQLDLERLPERNLGRDDRVIAGWGKEVRYPYLSLTLIGFLSELPVWLKCDLGMEEGEGDKRLLRLGARKLGMSRAAGRRKRAMQFGSRSARMGEADTKGHLKLGELRSGDTG